MSPFKFKNCSLAVHHFVSRAALTVTAFILLLCTSQLALAQASINVVKHTNGTDNNTAPGPLMLVGTDVSFRYDVTNPGSVPLSNVTVRDDNGTPGNLADDFNAAFVSGDSNNNGLLDPGELWMFSAGRDATPDQHTNTATATGTPSAGSPVTDTDVDNHFGVAPAINVVKKTNGTDNNTAPGVIVPVGSTVTFTYEVTNEGNVPLIAVSVGDDNGTPGSTGDDFSPSFLGGDTNNNSELDVGETWNYSSPRTASPGQYTNTATAIGFASHSGGLESVDDTDVDNHFGEEPAIDIVKLTNGTNNNTAPGPGVPVGSTVTFTYNVTNPTVVPLTIIAIADDNGTPGNSADDFTPSFTGGDTNNNNELDKGETWVYTASRIATPGQHTNTAIVIGLPPFGLASVSDTDVDNHFGGLQPWTTTGNSGAREDESNPTRLTYTNFTAAANAGSPSGTYVLRYNITATNNLIAIGLANTRLRVRYRDEGAGSRVVVKIMQANINGGSTQIGTLFDSDAFAPAGGYQTQEVVMAALTFDFTNNVYWLEVTLTKDSVSNQPGFGSAQIIQQ
jgi:uncharacterized repeat protein (TIGR01451 family)